jgi:hypothetical protein
MPSDQMAVLVPLGMAIFGFVAIWVTVAVEILLRRAEERKKREQERGW